MEERSYIVEGMTCDHCVRAVRTEVSAVAGVRSAAVDLDTKLLTVTGDPIDDAAIFAAVAEAGYDAVKGPTG